MKKTAKKIVAGTVGAAGLFLTSATAAVNADSVHHVVKNDTVWSLSQKYGVSIKSIEQLNHIDQNTNMIYVNQDLKIPNKNTQTPKNDTHTYTVQSGDSLWAIAQKLNMSVDHLKQLNGLTSNLIYAGQTLKVDGQATAQSTKTVKTVIQPIQTQTPVAKVSVASTTQKAAPVQQAQQSSVQSTVKSTPAAQSTVKAQVPVASASTPVSSATQAQSETSSVTSSSATTVLESQPASTVSSSASAVNSSSSSQQTVTSSSSSQAPVTSSVSSAAPASSVSSQSSSSKQAVIAANHTTATVKSGDSLYAIAQEYGVSVASLREANPNLGNSLTIGQSLIVNNPTKNPAAASSSSQEAQTSSARSQQQVSQAQPANNNQESAQNNNQQQSNNQVAKSSSQAQSSSTTRTGSGSNAVSFAESLIGVPYVYGGTTPSGFDCSGFVQYVYSHFGVNLPRTTTQQENCGTQIPVNQAQPGDLYFWGSKGSTYHVAICVGNGKYIAAPEPGQSVSIGSTQYFQPSFAVRL